MTRVVLDAHMCEKLLGLGQPADLCDESGRVVGVFMPLTEREAANRARPPITAEELQRRRTEPDYSTDEVIAYLENL